MTQLESSPVNPSPTKIIHEKEKLFHEHKGNQTSHEMFHIHLKFASSNKKEVFHIRHPTHIIHREHNQTTFCMCFLPPDVLCYPKELRAMIGKGREKL